MQSPVIDDAKLPWYELGTIDDTWYIFNEQSEPVRAATIYEIAMWREVRRMKQEAWHAHLNKMSAAATKRLTFRSWCLWAINPSWSIDPHSFDSKSSNPNYWSPPWYVRLWNGAVQVALHHTLPIGGCGTPGHGDSHRWWLDLAHPLRQVRCWWCGIEGRPGPLRHTQLLRWLFG